MDFRKAWLIAVSLASFAPQGPAHSDPWGDIMPFISVSGEKFIVTFRAQKENAESGGTMRGLHRWFRIIYSSAGKVLVPRHEIDLDAMYPAHLSSGRDQPSVYLFSLPAPPGASRFVLKETHPSGSTVETPLLIDSKDAVGRDHYTFAGPWISLTWTRMAPNLDDPQHPTIDLYLTHVARDAKSPGQSVRLGTPATIYDFPSASPPVWAEGRWWVAWVRPVGTDGVEKDERMAWKTILSSYQPASQKLEHKELDALSHWNTSVDLKTTGGWLCIAWHASQDGSYPGWAKIMTVFEEVPK